MSTFNLDLEGGNDGSDGTTYANRWLTFTSGATAARIAPGDTIRVRASPDPTLVGNADWTQYSKTVTLAGGVTATIYDCAAAFTASANVTATTTSTRKEGSLAASLAIASGFTTGLAAYRAISTTDFSAYQQVSFWIQVNATVVASTLSLRLCSDNAGVTTVDTIAIPAIATTGAWIPITVDKGSALGSSIQSVALYCDLDPGTVTVLLDNIIACKASSGDDSLSLKSLIGKVWNLYWAASTAYTLNHIRKPTPPNRNGLCYKCTTAGTSDSSEPTWPTTIGATVTDGSAVWTAFDLEETWYPIQSISGTTVLIDNIAATAANAGRGYHGATETVATYKREPINQTMVNSNAAVIAANTINDTGTGASPITYSGGWNRTDMSTQTGETWLSAQSGVGIIFSPANQYNTLENINGVRAFYGCRAGHDFIVFRNCHMNGHSEGFSHYSSLVSTFTNCVANNCGVRGFHAETHGMSFMTNVDASNCIDTGILGGSNQVWKLDLSGGKARNNASVGLDSGTSPVPWVIRNFVTANNAAATSFGGSQGGAVYLINCNFPESTEISASLGAFYDRYIFSQRHDQTANNHLITTDGGTIISATDQRNTASGIAWKFRPTSTNRHAAYPMRLSVAKVACAANALVTATIYVRRDSTNIQGKLVVRGGQIPGVDADVSVSCAPSINTWTQSGDLTFTPTEAGVVEFEFWCWDGTGTTNNLWVDDFAVSQA